MVTIKVGQDRPKIKPSSVALTQSAKDPSLLHFTVLRLSRSPFYIDRAPDATIRDQPDQRNQTIDRLRNPTDPERGSHPHNVEKG